MVSPWIPNIITFIMVLTTDGPIDIAIDVVIGIAFLPVKITIGLIAFLKVLPLSKQNKKIFFYNRCLC
jgi:heme/copper-type cytochrome/quinol oxidase subunit 4